MGDGIVYAPIGGGYMNSRLSVEVLRENDYYSRLIKNIESHVIQEKTMYMEKVKSKFGAIPDPLVFNMVINSEKIFIYEKNSKLLFEVYDFQKTT